MAPVHLTPDLFLSEEQPTKGSVLTPAQLHLLRQQIDALRRINVQLRVLKYKARTGQEPPLWSGDAVTPHTGGGSGGRGSRGGRGRGRSSRGSLGVAWEGLVISGGGRGRGRGRGRGGKRGREDESEEDDSIVVRSSEEEAEAGEEAALGSSSSEEEGGAADEYESADTSESEEDFTIPTVSAPRRTGRARRPTAVAVMAADAPISSSSDEGQGQEEGEEEKEDQEAAEQQEAETAAAGKRPQRQQQHQQQQVPEPAGPEGEEQGAPPPPPAAAAAATAAATASGQAALSAGAPSSGGQAAAAGRAAKQARRGKTGGKPGDGDGDGSGDGAQGKRKGLFMVVSESPAASTALQLPKLKPVAAFDRARNAGGDDGEEEGDRAEQCEVDVEAAAAGEGGEEEEEEDEQDVDEAVCSVCGDAEAPEGNLILLCEGKGCSVAVHQLCYGVREVPEDEWLCDACQAKLDPKAANCCVCPVVGCAMKKVTSLGRVVPANQPKGGKGRGRGRSKDTGLFCHLACALWVPEIELSDCENFSGVRLDKLTAVRVKLRCELCRQAGGGAVQCAFGTCCRSFHVLCGRAAGQQLQFRATDGEPLAFCGLHSKTTFAKLVDEMVDGKRPLELAGAPLEEEEEAE